MFLVRAPLGIGERSLLELALSLSVPVASFELIPRLYSFLRNALRTNRIVFLLSPKHHTLSFCFDKARINRSYAFLHTVDHANVFSNREATPRSISSLATPFLVSGCHPFSFIFDTLLLEVVNPPHLFFFLYENNMHD